MHYNIVIMSDAVSNHRRLDCLLNCLSRRRSKKTWKLCVTGICEGNSSVTGEFPAQRASNAEHVSIRWRHRVNVKMCHISASSDSVCNVCHAPEQTANTETIGWSCNEPEIGHMYTDKINGIAPLCKNKCNHAGVVQYSISIPNTS